MNDAILLDTYEILSGYFATDRTVTPPNALAECSRNVFLQGFRNQRIFRGLKDAGVGGRSMFNIAGGYAALVDSFGVLIEDAGEGNGTYTFRGNYNGKPYYCLQGEESDPEAFAISWDTDGLEWFIYDGDGNTLYATEDEPETDFPWEAGSWTADEGTLPAPTTLNQLNVEAYGSVFNFISNSLFWIGEGYVYRNGVLLDDAGEPFIATSNLQLSPREYTEAFTAGLAEPDAPQVEAKTAAGAFTGLLTGLYSFKIARVRSVTGGRSIASVTSAAITFAGQTCRMTFPAVDSNGQDRWAIFATKAGFGGTGVHYLVQEVDEADLSTIDGIPRSFEFEFNDADLLPVIAYIDDYPPPAGSFGGRIENYVIVVGAYDNAIACSIRNFPESFNPDDLAFLPKEPTAVLQDQQGSFLYISTESSVHMLSVAPSAFGNPMIMQMVWNDTGVAHGHNWCSVEGVIFAFVSRQGAVTMDANGRPTSEFAQPVAKAMQDWEPADTCVFSIPDLKSVAYCNGSSAYLFNVQNLQWSSPAIMLADGDVVAGVVVDRRLKISFLNGEDFDLYDFDEWDTGNETEFRIASADRILNPSGRVNILGTQTIFKSPNAGDFVTIVKADYGLRRKSATVTAAGVGMEISPLTRNQYLPRCEAVRVDFVGTQTDFDESFFLGQIEIWGTAEQSSRLISSGLSIGEFACDDDNNTPSGGGGEEDTFYLTTEMDDPILTEADDHILHT
jgi:hypothetical protein